MIKIMICEVIFCLEVAKYFIVYALSSKKCIVIRGKAVLYSAALFAIAVAIAGALAPIGNVYILILVGAVTLMFLNMKHKIINRLWDCFIMILSVTAVDSIFDNIYTKYMRNDLLSMEYDYLVWDGCFVSLLIAAYTIFSLYGKNSQAGTSKKPQLFVKIACIIADVCLCLSGTHIIKISKGEGFYFVFGLITLASAALLGSQIVGMLNLNNRLNEGINQERLLRGIQRDHYQSLIKNDREIRKYRHDMINHFMVIESYLEKGKTDSAKEYLRELEGEVLATSTKSYCLGNDVIDAISCYYLSEIEDVAQISIKGMVPDNIGISEISLCTVYSNLLKNAVEEIIKLKEAKEENLELSVEFKTGKSFFEIKIKNSAHYNNDFDGMYTLTSKSDDVNHGIGLSSVMYAIQKEQGEITLGQEFGYVLADAIIPIGDEKILAFN